ncbi:MAG: SDR family NAD(P)-dependent oxidoreductase [Rhodospirillaceae bacterium]|nr:SDR family NAD(P)-dependent oxidoreductase [Rhodospirillaceae bacterium]
MVDRVAGKVALVTGGASGLGRESAMLFAAEGARVAITDINEEGGRAVAEEIGEAAIFLPHDVTNEAQWIETVRQTVSVFGGLHILVHSAGIGLTKKVEEI